jgi:hypothetical protein
MSEKITVSCDLFVDFVKKSTVNGEIPQLLLKQTEKGYEVSVMAENVISCEGVIYKKNFIMFGSVGNITIKDTKKFISLLKDLQGNVTIEKKENKIIIHGDKTDIEYVLCSEEFIETTSEPITIDFDDGFKISKDFFISVSSKATLLDVSSVVLQVNNKILRGIVEETDKYIIKEEVPYKDCESGYGRWLFKLSQFLEDKINVSFDNNYPVRIMSKNTNFELSYYIAPFVKTEQAIAEEEKKEKEEQKQGVVDDT